MSKNDRPVGPKVVALPPGTAPDLRPLHGRYARLEALDAAKHGAALWAAHQSDATGITWTYMWNDPWPDEELFRAALGQRSAQRDPWFYAYVNRASGHAQGMGAFMRFDKASGVIEVGHIWLAPALQKTREATEVIFLMMRHAFDDLGCRRLEWKCDALNAASRRAAERFGFTFEGIFRQHMIYKGRNRDTAWYAMIDKDWPRIKAGFEAWLQASNFDAKGQQKAKLKVQA